MGKYDSEESKSSKEKKVPLMTSLGDLMSSEEAAVACAKRREALCFVRLRLEQILVPVLNNCAEMLREGSKLAKSLLLQALWDMHQSKPLRVNMKKPVELVRLRKIEEIHRLSNKKLRLTRESMVTLLKSSEYCEQIRKKSYHYVLGIVGMAYNPFIKEVILGCYFDYKRAAVL